MPAFRFNHMELTLPKGALARDGDDIRAFYTDIFAMDTLDVPLFEQTGLLLRTDPETSQFILLMEADAPLRAPGYDHLGFLYETRAEVDERLEQCRKWQARDDRVQIKEYDDLTVGDTVVRAFYVRYLLPIWFDVQVIENTSGAQPDARWRYGAE